MKMILAVTALLLIFRTGYSADIASPQLPFSPDAISRLSLDNKPRSLSIRQGTDMWLGYDLERATLLKVWKAPEGKSGLTKSGFVTRSTGTPWFEDASNETWELERNDQRVPLTVRYLGCSQRADHFELRWELRHENGVVKLAERISNASAEKVTQVVRELRAENLADGEVLLPPPAVRKSWKQVDGNPTEVMKIRGGVWRRLSLSEPGAKP